jgi:hypothetical protein
MPELLEAVSRAEAELLALRRDRAVARTENDVTALFVAHFAHEWRELHRRMTAFRDLFPAEESMTQAEVKRFISQLSAVQAAVAATMTKEAAKRLWRAFLAGHTHAAERMLLQTSFSVPQPRAVAWMLKHAAELVKGIDDVTRARVAAIVTQAVEEGWSYTKTEQALKVLYKGFRLTLPQQHILSRARLIAVHEAAVAYGQGQMELGRWLAATGLEIEKSWLTVGGDRVCEICAGNEGDGWIALEDGFSSGAECEPEHPACRCVTLQRLAQQAAAA